MKERTIKDYHRIFKLYQRIRNKRELLASQRYQGYRGILVNKDYNAVQYQKYNMRFNILESFLKGERPNWFNATYLTNEQAEERNSYYY